MRVISGFLEELVGKVSHHRVIRLGLQGEVWVIRVYAGFHGCALREGKTLVKHFGGNGGSYGWIFMVGIDCFGFGYLFG